MKWLSALTLLTLLFSAAASADDALPYFEVEGRIVPPLVDRMHAGLQTRVNTYARSLDNFFVDERTDEEAGDSQVRLIGSIEHREGGGFSLTPHIKARLNLPHLQRKINLLIDTESDDISSLTDHTSGTRSSSDFEEETNIAIQLVQKSTTKIGISHRAALSMRGDKPNLKIRSRARFTWQATDLILLRFTQAVFWHKFDGFGQESRFDFEHLLHPPTPHNHLLHIKDIHLSSLLRISLRGLTSEASDGYEWSIPIEVLTALSKRRAYAYGGSISGVTDTDSGITNSAIFIRYRQSLWRDWFFFDITPQLEWPKANGRNTTGKITLSLEVLL